MRGSCQQLFRFASVACCLILAACGSGGGGGGSSNNGGSNGSNFSLSTNTLTFTAAGPGARVLPQEITATLKNVSGGTLYLKIIVNGPAVSMVDDVTITSQTSGYAIVYPAVPSSLGVGTFSSTITVFACMDDPSCASGQLDGSPQVVNVTYQIDSWVRGDAVAPRIAIANVPGKVILRGHGFSTANIQNVTFGVASATAFSIVSDTEIHADYPALAAANYPVQLSTGTGTVPFAADLAVVNPPNYAATTLAYPSGPQRNLALLYDAERQALLVGTNLVNIYAPYATWPESQILRYQFSNGAWQPPTSVVIPYLKDAAISIDGKRLFAISDNTLLTEVDVETLVSGATATPPTDNVNWLPGVGLKNIVVTNDGNALVTTSSGVSVPYHYSSADNKFFPLNNPCVHYPAPGVSADGSFVSIIQGPLSPPQPVCQYDASSGLISESNLNLNQVSVVRALPPMPDRTANRILIIANPFSAKIYDRNYQYLGDLPGVAIAAAIKPDGSRAYLFDDAGTLRTFDLTQNPVGGFFPEVGTGTPLPADPGYTNYPYTTIVRMLVSQDGGTLFIAGDTRIVILPSP